MANKYECAVLSAAAYDNSRNSNNQLKLSGVLGWVKLDDTMNDMMPGQTRGGFSATAYQKGNEIVIAYKGTDFLLETNKSATLQDLGNDLGV